MFSFARIASKDFLLPFQANLRATLDLPCVCGGRGGTARGGGGGPPRPMGNKSLLRASVSFFRIRSDSCAFFSSFSYDTVNKDRRSALEDPFGPRTKANCAFALFFAPSSYVSTHTAENEDTVLRTYRTYDSRLPEKEFPALLC